MAAIVRRRRWSRWKGQRADLVAAAEAAEALVRARTSDDPTVLVIVVRNADEEDRYETLQQFAEGSSDEDLVRAAAIQMTFAPKDSDAAAVVMTFARAVPAVALEVTGTDRIAVEGMRSELARQIDRGRTRVPAPNYWATLAFGFVVGVAYFYAFQSTDLSFLPDNVLGTIIGLSIFGGGWIGCIFGLTRLLSALLPPLQLTRTGDRAKLERLRSWAPAALGSAALGIVPFALDKIF
jgi:hypothetical protein